MLINCQARFHHYSLLTFITKFEEFLLFIFLQLLFQADVNPVTSALFKHLSQMKQTTVAAKFV